MANYTFPADGVLRPDAIKFYPRDASGAFVTGVQLTVASGCGTLSNRRETTDNQGNDCLLYDYTPPTNNTGQTCVIQASINGSTCNCPLTITGQQLQIDCGSVNLTSNPSEIIVGEQVEFTFTVVDTNGNPVANPSVSNTGLTNATLSDSGNGIWTYTGIANAESGTISIFSDIGDCQPLTFTASTVQLIDCSNIFCDLQSNYIVGQPNSISIFVPDDSGNAISSGVNFEFDGATVSTLPTYNTTNGRWEFEITPTAEGISASLTSGNQVCADFCTITAITIGIDCDSIVCDTPENDFVVGQSSTQTITVIDSSGNPITSNVMFSLQGASLDSVATYNSATQKWSFDFTPQQEQTQVSVLSDIGNCNNACTITAVQPNIPMIDCANVNCSGNLVIGQPGEIRVTVQDFDGQAFGSGISFNFAGASINSAPVFDTESGEWVIGITANGVNVIGSILSSEFGNCNNACTITATEQNVPTVACNLVQCIEPQGGYTIGEAASLSVYVPDSDGNSIASNVTFDFTGATLNSTPTWNSVTGNWDFEIIPTDENITGSILTSTFGNCSNFCTITAIPDGDVECCDQITDITFSPLVVSQVFNGSISFEGDSVASITGLPPGISANGNSLSGVPTQAGTYNISARTANNCETVITVVVSEESTNNGGGNSCPKLETVSLPTGIVGDPYSGFAVFSGAGSRTYQQIGLPPGLSLNQATGQITGTPTQVGNFNIDYSVTDSTGTCNYRLTIDVDRESENCPEDCPRLASVPSLFANTGDQVNVTLSAFSQGDSQVVFTAGQIGGGLNINSSGVITGVASEAGVYPFNVEMTSNGRTCISQQFFRVQERTVEQSHCDSVLMTVCAGAFDLDMQDTEWTLDSVLPQGLSFASGKFLGELSEGISSIRLSKSDGATFKMVLCVRECCTKSDDTSGNCWVQMISCQTVNGITYNNSLDCPSDPIRVSKSQFDHLVMNGLAVACI